MYRESNSSKAFLLAAASGIGVCLVVAIRGYLALHAQQLSPHPQTGFPPSFGLLFGFVYAIPTAVIVFVASLLIFGIVDLIRRKRPSGDSDTKL